MSTVIYLANQQVEVVMGTPGEHRISVERSFSAEAPEGSIINGIVMDTELFVEFMKEFWTKNNLPQKDVILVVNSSKFTGKIIEMPELNMKKSYEFIAREFADVNRSENYLYSYLPLGTGNGKTKRIYSESIEPDFVRDYIEIFREIGITLKSILSGESSLIRLTDMTTGRAYKNFVHIIADSSILTTILWINGSFYYFNSMRCFHERETEDYAGDVARSASQIVQFMQAHQIEEKLESIVIAGIEQNNLPMYKKAVEQMGILTSVQLFEATTLVPSQQVDIQKCLRATSGLVNNGKYLNFQKQYANHSNKKKKNTKTFEINYTPIIMALLVMIVLIAGTGIISLCRRQVFTKIDAYNNSPEVISSVAAYDMLITRNNYLSAQRNKISDIDADIQTYPICNSEVMNLIEGCADGYAVVNVDSFDATEGTIQIMASSDSVDHINQFIRQLNEQDIFNNVDYTGYAYNDETQYWDIHVTCTLAEAAGR